MAQSFLSQKPLNYNLSQKTLFVIDTSSIQLNQGGFLQLSSQLFLHSYAKLHRRVKVLTSCDAP